METETKLIQGITKLETEVKYMRETLSKVEKVLENQGVLLEKQNVANKRILNLEKANDNQNNKIRKLEDWQLKIITITTIVATVGSTIFGLILKKLF